MNKQPMTVENFLEVMSRNRGLWPEFDALLDGEKEFLARVNISHGTADSYFKDGKLWGVGGIRYVGMGEAWLIGPPETRKDLTMPEFNFIKEEFERQRDSHNLIRVFATTKISECFLRRLGFVAEPKAFVWTRI